MPIDLHVKHPKGFEIVIWKIDEPELFFLEQVYWDPQQMNWLDSIHPLRRRDYLASRYLIYQFTGLLESHLYKDEAGKLYLKDRQEHISISHSGSYSGLALCNKNIGFDLQGYSPKIIRVAQRFLSQLEKENMGPNASIEELTQAWTVKEAVYKAYGQKGIQFNRQIKIDIEKQAGQQSKMLQAKLIDQSIELKYEIYSKLQEEYCYSLAIE